MTVEEAIKHCIEVAEQSGDCQCAEDHRQLAEWLRDYQKIKAKRNNDVLWDALSEVYNMSGLPDKVYEIVGDVMLGLYEEGE